MDSGVFIGSPFYPLAPYTNPLPHYVQAVQKQAKARIFLDTPIPGYPDRLNIHVNLKGLGPTAWDSSRFIGTETAYVIHLLWNSGRQRIRKLYDDGARWGSVKTVVHLPLPSSAVPLYNRPYGVRSEVLRTAAEFRDPSLRPEAGVAYASEKWIVNGKDLTATVPLATTHHCVVVALTSGDKMTALRIIDKAYNKSQGPERVFVFHPHAGMTNGNIVNEHLAKFLRDLWTSGFGHGPFRAHYNFIETHENYTLDFSRLPEQFTPSIMALKIVQANEIRARLQGYLTNADFKNESPIWRAFQDTAIFRKWTREHILPVGETATVKRKRGRRGGSGDSVEKKAKRARSHV
jgi:hypothetical protein